MTHDEKLAELEAKHGQIAHVKLKGLDYYFRKPSMGEFQRASDKMAKKGSDLIPLKELTLSCSVGDDPTDALSDLPAAIQQIGVALVEMAGSEVTVNISKGSGA